MKDNYLKIKEKEENEPQPFWLFIAFLTSLGLFGLGYFVIWLILALTGGR